MTNHENQVLIQTITSIMTVTDGAISSKEPDTSPSKGCLKQTKGKQYYTDWLSYPGVEGNMQTRVKFTSNSFFQTSILKPIIMLILTQNWSVHKNSTYGTQICLK